MTAAVTIEIPEIEKEFDRLWKKAQGEKQQKACLFTLIIYAHDPHRVQYLQDLIDGILERFPCRIIFIKGDGEASRSYFYAKVSIAPLGNLSGNQKSAVGCDQITLEASKDQLFRVPCLVTAHLIPDLPVYLLWGQNPFEENAIFPHLQNRASRVIFDSECCSSLPLFCKEMLENMRGSPREVIDINWALVSNWRDLLYHLFSTQEKIEELRGCQALAIRYNQTGMSPMQKPQIRAIYLQGWLASCLNWHIQSVSSRQGTTVIQYDNGGQPLEVTLIAQEEENLPTGGIASIEMALKKGATYSLQRKPHLSQVVVHASSSVECQLPFTLPLANVHRGLTFLKELFYFHPSDHYRRMLEVIVQLK